MDMSNALFKGPMGEMLKGMMQQSEEKNTEAQIMAKELQDRSINQNQKLIDAINRLSEVLERMAPVFTFNTSLEQTGVQQD